MRLCSLLVVLAAVQVGCASTGLTLPSGATDPFPDYQAVFERAVDPCRRMRTMELAMAIRARTGETRLRGDLLAALARPARLRLVGVAPFGSPGFVLVVDADAAVLVLPRDRRVVTDATADELLGALAGVTLGAEDFRSVLTGCVVPDPQAINGRLHDNGWIAVAINGEATAYVHLVKGVPVVVAGERPGLTVWYSDHVRGIPRRIDVRATSATGVLTELTATLSQVSINIDLNPDVFVPQIREDYVPMSLEQFRGTPGPLESPIGASTEPQ